MKFFQNILLAGLFLSVQAFAVAHAATNDASEHQHKGVECSICIQGSDAQKILAAPALSGSELILAHQVEPSLVQDGISFVFIGTKLIRGPPVFIQQS